MGVEGDAGEDPREGDGEKRGGVRRGEGSGMRRRRGGRRRNAGRAEWGKKGRGPQEAGEGLPSGEGGAGITGPLPTWEPQAERGMSQRGGGEGAR